MDAFSRIQNFLHLTRQALRRHALLRAGLYTGAGLSLVGLLVPLGAEALAEHHGASLAWTGLLCASIILCAGIASGVVRPLRRWRSDWRVARYVGTRQPAVASDLLSAVELGERGVDQVASTRHISGDLVRALFEQTAKRLDEIVPGTLLARGSLERGLAVCAAVFLIHGAVVILVPEIVAAGWQRVLHPSDPRPFGGAAMSDTPLVGDLGIMLQYPAYSGRPPQSLPSSSGDFRAMPGTIVTIETTALVPAARARIVFESTDTYSDTYSDAYAAPEPSVAQTPAPPAPAAPGPHDTTPERPAAPRATELPVEVREGGAMMARFPVQSAGSYRFLIETPTSQRRVESITRQIEIEPDRAPEVQLYTPGDELDVTSLKRIELAYIAEDDYGIAKIELVWADRGKIQRKELPRAQSQRSAQGKLLWDLAEISLEPGVAISYHVEVTDNDTVMGPNIGRSRTFQLRVFSPREKHEQLMTRQRELFEKMLAALGARLTVAAEDIHAHTVLQREAAALVIELGTVVTALGSDELAVPDLGAALAAMRARLDKLSRAESSSLAQLSARPAQGGGKQSTARLAASDSEHIAELEDDVILLADWLSRQQMENLLAISDEIKTHQDRLRQLFKEYERTGSTELLAEMEREVRTLQKRLLELASERAGMPEDVLDRFVNSEAIKEDESMDCMSEVHSLLAGGDAEAARRKLEECMKTLDSAAEAMEQALRDLRSDAFSEEERKFGEIMDRLTDLAQDQADIATSADRVWERYAERADEMMREETKETRKHASKQLERLRKQLGRIPDSGLTPFAREELDIVEARLADVERMLGDGDIAEALAMARQAEEGLETMAAELSAAMLDEQDEPWSERTIDAQREVGRSQPLARKLVEELEASTPSPREIMTPEDRRELGRLRRRQQSAVERARKLGERARQMAGDLPGRAGEAISQGLDAGQAQMGRAGERMRMQDPSGARQESRGAAETLQRTVEGARDAARGKQAAGPTGLRDEPIRIPGADQYKPPEKFREDILEAMKREKAPDGFGDLVKRYYEELIR